MDAQANQPKRKTDRETHSKRLASLEKKYKNAGGPGKLVRNETVEDKSSGWYLQL
jgi:hypothetical protein